MFARGELIKTAECSTGSLGNNDMIYGGLGDDFLHGNEGSDAISGAEALRYFYNAAFRNSGLVRLATEVWAIDPDPLHYDPATTLSRRSTPSRAGPRSPASSSTSTPTS